MSEDQESRLVKFVIAMARIGYGVTKKELPFTVKDVLDAGDEEMRKEGFSPEKEKFKDNLPSKCWVYRFLKRWPELSSRLPENLGHQRAHVTEDKIRNWFNGLEDFLLEEHCINANDFLSTENGSRIFNLDESGFPLAGTNGKLKIITSRGSKNVYKMTPDSKEQVTVLCCADAAGKLSKPYVIFPGVRPKFNFEGVNPDDYYVGNSPNGWMSADCFFGWLANCFYPSVQDTVEFPIIIFMDGHTSHINVAVAEFCAQKNIILYCFPPHASHMLQPLDVSVFGPFKKHWNNSLDEFGRKFKGLSMSRTHFFPVFQKCWEKAVESPGNVVSGFRKCGLVPFNVEAVDFDRLIKPPPSSFSPTKQSQLISEQEKIGMIRMFHIVRSNLSPAIRSQFEKRWENNYDVEDCTDKGVLWKIYKESRKAINFDCNYEPAKPATQQHEPCPNINSLSNVNPTINIIASTSLSPVKNIEIQEEISESTSIASCSTPTPSDIRVITEDIIETNNNDVRELSFSAWDYSPFKKHLKIADHVLITRKNVKTKPKAPPAISGKQYCEYLKKQQDEKKRLFDEKEKRKLERLQKGKTQKNKSQKGKKRKRTVEDTSEEEIVEETDEEDEGKQEENQMVLDSDSDCSLKIDNEMCNACYGKENWSVPEAWIGCSGRRCEKWFHKECISGDICSMTDDELKDYQLLCESCSKLNYNQNL